MSYEHLVYEFLFLLLKYADDSDIGIFLNNIDKNLLNRVPNSKIAADVDGKCNKVVLLEYLVNTRTKEKLLIMEHLKALCANYHSLYINSEHYLKKKNKNDLLSALCVSSDGTHLCASNNTKVSYEDFNEWDYVEKKDIRKIINLLIENYQNNHFYYYIVSCRRDNTKDEIADKDLYQYLIENFKKNNIEITFTENQINKAIKEYNKRCENIHPGLYRITINDNGKKTEEKFELNFKNKCTIISDKNTNLKIKIVHRRKSPFIHLTSLSFEAFKTFHYKIVKFLKQECLEDCSWCNPSKDNTQIQRKKCNNCKSLSDDLNYYNSKINPIDFNKEIRNISYGNDITTLLDLREARKAKLKKLISSLKEENSNIKRKLRKQVDKIFAEEITITD